MDALTQPGIRGLLFACLLLLAQAGNTGTFELDSRAEIRRVEAQVRATQFLTRATFGPTQQEIDELTEQVEQLGERAAFEAWIDNQFEIPASEHRELAITMVQADGLGLVENSVIPSAYREYAWWNIALEGEDQLRQRMAWALYQIAPVNTDVEGAFQRRFDESGYPAWLGLSNYYDTLAANAFGNYRNLLRDITLHPVMGTYLSHALNPKGVPAIGQYPDENYAREVLQLFSIGVYELRPNGQLRTTGKDKTPIETYDSHTIEAMARVFTGLYYANTRGFGSNGRNYHDPMQMSDGWHDTDQKTILSGAVLPAGQTGMQDIEDALDVIFNHRNVGPHIGKRLIQRLVKSNPSRRYIRAVTDAFDNNGSGVRGDMRAVVKAILLHPEALESLQIRKRYNRQTLTVEATNSKHSRLREPILRYTSFLRALDVSSTHPSGRVIMNGAMNDSLQSPYKTPDVFGFYDSDYIPARTLQLISERNERQQSDFSAPEFKIMTSAAIPALDNNFHADITNGGHKEFYIDGATGERRSFDILIDFTDLKDVTGAKQIVSRLNLLFCRGAMSDATSEIISAAIKEGFWSKDQRIRAALLLTLTAPDCAVVQ